MSGLVCKRGVRAERKAKSWLFIKGVVCVATGIIIAVILVICIFGIKSYFKRLASGCCGTGGNVPIKKVKAADNNKRHYDRCLLLEIEGMVCANCARRIENALNILDGVWATVDLEGKKVIVRLKGDYPSDELLSAVRSAGYTVMSIKDCSMPL